jgi:hypothetical protein
MGVKGLPMIASALFTNPKPNNDRKSRDANTMGIKNVFIDLLLF